MPRHATPRHAFPGLAIGDVHLYAEHYITVMLAHYGNAQALHYDTAGISKTTVDNP
jgi:hypothetical protein